VLVFKAVHGMAIMRWCSTPSCWKSRNFLGCRNFGLSAVCGADTPGPILIKFGVLVAPCDVIKMCNFCNKSFRGFRSTGGQIPRLSIDFAGHRYEQYCVTSQPVICMLVRLVSYETTRLLVVYES